MNRRTFLSKAFKSMIVASGVVGSVKLFSTQNEMVIIEPPSGMGTTEFQIFGVSIVENSDYKPVTPERYKK